VKTVLMFSGQGDQYPGMFLDVFDSYKEAEDILRTAKELWGNDPYKIIMNSSQEILNKTENTQTCLIVCQLAVLQILQKMRISYQAAIGFSLGEWAALVAVGSVSKEDVLKMIPQRANAMERATPSDSGGMAVLLGQKDVFVQKLCQEIGEVAPSNYNCPGNISVAGTSKGIDRLLQEAEKRGIPAKRIAITVPSHSMLMEPAEKELWPSVEGLPMIPPNAEFIMNVSGKAVCKVNEIRKNLVAQLTHPVLFRQSLELLLEQEYDMFLEVGPGKTLSGFVKRTAKAMGKTVSTFSINNFCTLQEAQNLLS